MYENNTILLTSLSNSNKSNKHLERSIDISTGQKRQKHTQKLDGEGTWDRERPPFQQLSVRFSLRPLPLVKPRLDLDLFQFRDRNRIVI